jgi:hypothetical protein
LVCSNLEWKTKKPFAQEGPVVTTALFQIEVSAGSILPSPPYSDTDNTSLLEVALVGSHPVLENAINASGRKGVLGKEVVHDEDLVASLHLLNPLVHMIQVGARILNGCKQDGRHEVSASINRKCVELPFRIRLRVNDID